MSSRLPETELANWAFFSPLQKWEALEGHIKPKAITGSYEPFRNILADAVNRQLPLFADAEQPATPWIAIEHRLRADARCRRDADTLKMNLEIAKATHEFASQKRVIAVPVDVTSLAFGVGHLYQFALPFLVRYEGKVFAVFLDLRRRNGLSARGRHWVFAAMHERFRTAYPDLASIGLQIWRYRANRDRTIVPIVCEQISVGFNEMVADVRETYAVYGSVLAWERNRKRGASGGAGPLFG